MRTRFIIGPGVIALAVAAGCGVSGDGESGDLPTSPPEKVEKLGDDFSLAGAVEASPDGKTFYTLAYDQDMRPAVYAVDVDTGDRTVVHAGAPLYYPTDLAVTCDGETLLVSDLGMTAELDEIGEPMREAPVGAIHRIELGGGDPVALPADGIGRAAGIVLGVDCATLWVTGWTPEGMPAVFTLPADGGTAKVLYQGEPLVSPTGVHVDADLVAWVMDHEAKGKGGDGALFAITDKGDISEVASGLGMGRHGGVSLTPGGVTAVIPGIDPQTGESRLYTANTQTGETSVVPTPDIEHPTGVAAARNAPVMVVAGESGLHIATFDAD